MAYKDKARSREDLFRYQMAADYSDGWMEVKSSQGNLFGGFSSFYICRAGAVDSQCNSLILNKDWMRMREDIWAPKQKWKCRCCGTRYLTKFGMVVEIGWVAGGSALSLAPCTDEDDKDLHALILQDRFRDVNTAQELYDLIRRSCSRSRGSSGRRSSRTSGNRRTSRSTVSIYIYIRNIYIGMVALAC